MAHEIDTPSPSLLHTTRSAIEILQGELALAKKENQKLRRSQETKTQQFKELKAQLEAQQNRLSGIDGKLDQDKKALAAACNAAQSKDAELATLRQLNHTQTEAISKLEKKIAEAEAKVVSLHAKEAALDGSVNDLENQSVAKDSALDNLNSRLQEERALHETAKQRHAAEILHLTSRLAEKEEEWEKRVNAIKFESAGSSTNGKESKMESESASLHQSVEQVAHERHTWEGERDRLIKECRRRLDNAEVLLDQAIQDAAAHRKHAESTVLESKEQLHRVESYWKKKLQDAVETAKDEERRRIQTEINEAAKYQQLHSMLDEEMHEKMESTRRELMTNLSSFRQYFEGCIEKLTERVVRHQNLVERRQECLLHHIKELANHAAL